MTKVITQKGYPVQKPFETMDEVNAYFAAEKLTCLICGNEYVSLHVHLRNSHGIAADEYKEQYGIPWRRGLIANSLKEKQASIMNEQRAKGILPQAPPSSHIEKLVEASKHNRRPVQKAVRNAQKAHGLSTHGRTEKWGAKDFEEYLTRIKSGRTVTEVGKDKDMPCREVFDAYKRENSKFREKFEKIWDELPYSVQVRGQKLGARFKKEMVVLRQSGKSWPEIARILEVKESTPRNTWHRLKQSGKLEQYL